MTNCTIDLFQLFNDDSPSYGLPNQNENVSNSTNNSAGGGAGKFNI